MQIFSLHVSWPLIKCQATTAPSGFHKADIPRFTWAGISFREQKPSHREAAWPWQAADVRYNRRSRREGCPDLISLSSRRRGRHIAQMPAVRAGGRNNPLHLFRYILIESSFIHKYIEHNSSDLGTVFQFLRSIHNRKRNLDSQYSEICLSTKFASKCSVQTLFLVYIFQKSSHVPNGVESPWYNKSPLPPRGKGLYI